VNFGTLGFHPQHGSAPKLTEGNFFCHSEGNTGKVATQLSLYARSLVFRTGVNIKDIRCAWFDEQDCYIFAPGW